jgi:hypothetical protein
MHILLLPLIVMNMDSFREVVRFPYSIADIKTPAIT